MALSDCYNGTRKQALLVIGDGTTFMMSNRYVYIFVYLLLYIYLHSDILDGIPQATGM